MKEKLDKLIDLSKDFGMKIAQIRVKEMMEVDKKIVELKEEILKEIEKLGGLQ